VISTYVHVFENEVCHLIHCIEREMSGYTEAYMTLLNPGNVSKAAAIVKIFLTIPMLITSGKK